MKSVETTGKTLEEAQEAALAELQESAEAVDFEVIEEPHKILGLLGSTGEFKVRATVREAAPAAEEQLGAPKVQPINQLSQEGQGGTTEQIVAGRAQEFLAETTQLMGLKTDVVVTEVIPGEVSLDIRGDGLALLIGRHGTTLDALQLLVAVVANAGLNEGTRIIVDAENYRARRREMLEAMATSHAAKAKETQQEVVIPGLKAFERRIVHLTLKEDPEVETYSEGEGEERCIVISPRTA
jgi:spoIIIJ-associated protein